MGKLILFGNTLGEGGEHLFSAFYSELIPQLDGVIGESDKGARRFLAYFRHQLDKPIHHIPVALFRKKTDTRDINFLLEPIEAGETWGYVSDAGWPCVADPGHLLVQRCRKKNIPVEACLGPSAIFYALVLSGFDGNRFAFNGYFPKEPQARKQEILRAQKERGAQIYIEAPYRNQAAFESLLENLDDQRLLCIAKNLTLLDEEVATRTVATWRERGCSFAKEPVVFLFEGSF